MASENTDRPRGWCLEVHDLAIAKYVAGRPKDLDFTKVLAIHGMTSRELLIERLAVTGLVDEPRQLTATRIAADFRSQCDGPPPEGTK